MPGCDRLMTEIDTGVGFCRAAHEKGRPRRGALQDIGWGRGSEPARHGRDARACHAHLAKRAHQVGEGVDLFRRAGHLEDEALQGAVDHVGAEDFRDAEAFHAGVALGEDLDQRQFAADMRAFDGQVGHLVHGHHAFELHLDLVDHLRGAAGHDGDARAAPGMVHLGHGEAFDVVAAPREEPDDARQHARFVRDQDGQGMGHDLVRHVAAKIVGGVAGRALFDVERGHVSFAFS